MRRLNPAPKERRKVSIPEDLRDSMREVFELIREAKRDPDIIIDYDDAIQIGAVCGGKVGTRLGHLFSHIILMMIVENGISHCIEQKWKISVTVV